MSSEPVSPIESDNNAYFLKCERIGFRLWTPGDLPLALKLWGDPEVTKFIDARGQLGPAQVHERLFKEIAMQDVSGVQYWPIFRLDNDDFIGCCGLRPYGQKDDVLELGAHLRVAYWTQGYGTEAARAVIRFAFERLRITALFAGHNPKNLASRHLVHKLGFRFTHDEYYAPTGLQHPSYLLTREQWLLKQPSEKDT